jgi:hypothetical protein
MHNTNTNMHNTNTNMHNTNTNMHNTNIINLTQHTATPEQAALGVVEPADKHAVQQLLTFDEPPTESEILYRAEKLAELAAASGCHTALIGGAPYFMAPLERALRAHGLRPVYAFSKRVSEEIHRPDGSVEKRQIFKHAGFVDAC